MREMRYYLALLSHLLFVYVFFKLSCILGWMLEYKVVLSFRGFVYYFFDVMLAFILAVVLYILDDKISDGG